MYLKIHNTKEGPIVAACDEELIGKVLIEGKKILDLEKYKNFYVGEKAKDSELIDALKNCSSANIVGKKAVAIAVKAGIVSKDQVMHIKSFPYIQLYRI